MRKIIFKGFCNRGFEGQTIGIETDIRNGFPGFDIIGLSENSAKESKERIKAAMRNSGFKFPQNHVLVSLSPSSLQKTPNLLDLPIALSIVFATSKRDNACETVSVMAAGELSLTGEIIDNQAAIGILGLGTKSGCRFFLVPFETNSKNGAFHVKSLTEAFLVCGNIINGEKLSEVKCNEPKKQIPLFSGLTGMDYEKEILTLCAAGWHSILMFGPPGVGKTSLSNSLINLLPDTEGSQLEDVRHIYGCAQIELTSARPPCRIVPHDCSMTQFTGGRSPKMPGEGALAHAGVLILDELNSYSRKLTDSVREAYDKGFTFSSKSGETTVYPASFLLAANMNVCPCGGLGNLSAICSCTAQKISSYWSGVGNALIDRFDIRIPVKQYNLNSAGLSPSKPDSYYIEKVQIARERQKYRYKDLSGISLNGQLHTISGSIADFLPKEVEILARMSESANTNFRVFNSIVTLARSLADIDDRDNVTEEDMFQALFFKKFCHGDYYWREIR